MSGSLTRDVVKTPPPPPIGGDFGDGGGSSWGASRRASLTGLLVLFAATTMLFAAFTSAYIVRRGLSNDWIPTPLPWALWLNTVVLILSSAVLEVGRRRLKSGRRAEFNWIWTAGTALGVLFLLGQGWAWRQLHQIGIYIASNPSSSFFFLLTAAHAIHLLGGITALVYVDVQAMRLRLGPGKRTAVDVSAFFWHFLAALWVYLLILLIFWG